MNWTEKQVWKMDGQKMKLDLNFMFRVHLSPSARCRIITELYPRNVCLVFIYFNVYVSSIFCVVVLLSDRLRELHFPSAQNPCWSWQWNYTKSYICELKTKIESHLGLAATLWIPQLSSLAWTWSIALLLFKLLLIYGRIIYNAVLHDSLLLPESALDSKTDYMLD